MKRKLRLTASACLLGCLVLLNACNTIIPSGDTDPVDTGSYTVMSESASDTEVSHPLPRGEEPFDMIIAIGTHPASDNPKLPENVHYLDDTRDLKDTYTADKAVSRYAIRLYNSTVICNNCDEYIMHHSFHCTDYSYDVYACDNTVFLKDTEYLSGDVTLQDTVFTSLSKFKQELEGPGLMCIKDAWARGHSEEFDKSTIIEETDEFIFASIETIDFSNTSHYQYYFAEEIGGRVYLTWYRTYNNSDIPMTDNQLGEFKKLSLLVFDHLEKDDGKEPYIYDKFVNLGWFGGMRLNCFSDIENISTSCGAFRYAGDKKEYYGYNISFRVKDLGFCVIKINPDERDLSRAEGAWEDVGDMKVRIDDDGYNKTQQLLFTKNGVRYLVYFSAERFDGTLESSDAFIGYLKSKKALI